ncbi:MAG: hypothetical protein CMM44_07640 [Rhodospirillaceae bacterium]|nr:hypothetical protein [Rhodospirillaceae bacterium]|tara:strand:- start:4888 stop:5640 length:753 start_codon:yes stop_codon:yes gene_type:complete
MPPTKSKAVITPLIDEPWVHLADGTELKNWNKEDEIAYNQANRQIGKYEMFVGAMDFIRMNEIQGDYFEFGCHKCRTFRMALTEARRRNLNNMEFYAFDSFEGLPEVKADTTVDLWKKGVLATSVENFMKLIEKHGIYVDKVHTVKGFYNESLNEDLKLSFSDKKAALINVDCDLYESAVPVFDFIEDFVQEGTIIYMDDLFCGYKGSPERGVARAFIEYQNKSAFKFASHMNVGWWGRTFIAHKPENSL